MTDKEKRGDMCPPSASLPRESGVQPSHPVAMSAEERARDIMDQACLSETYVNNGVDGALRRDIAAAIRAAEDAILETVAIEAETRREKNAASPASKAAYTNMALFARSLKQRSDKP